MATSSEGKAVLQRTYAEAPEFFPYGLSLQHFEPGDVFIVKSASGDTVGWVGWQARSEGMKKIGYYAIGILPEFRQQGFGRAAVNMVLRKRASEVDEVRALIEEQNAPSRALARSLAIPMETRDGVVKQAKFPAELAWRAFAGVPTAVQAYNSSEDAVPNPGARALISGALGVLIGTAAHGGKVPGVPDPGFMSTAIRATGTGLAGAGISTAMGNLLSGVANSGRSLAQTAANSNKIVEQGTQGLELLTRYAPWLIGGTVAGTGVLAAADLYKAQAHKAFVSKLEELERRRSETGDYRLPEIENQEATEASAAADFDKDASFGSKLVTALGNPETRKLLSAALGGYTGQQAYEATMDPGVNPLAPSLEAQAQMPSGSTNFGRLASGLTGMLSGWHYAGRLPATGMRNALGKYVAPLTAAPLLGSATGLMTGSMSHFVRDPILEIKRELKPATDRLGRIFENMGGAMEWLNENRHAATAVGVGVPLLAGVASIAATHDREASVNRLLDYMRSREGDRVGPVETPIDRLGQKAEQALYAELPNLFAPKDPEEEHEKAAGVWKALAGAAANTALWDQAYYHDRDIRDWDMGRFMGAAIAAGTGGKAGHLMHNKDPHVLEKTLALGLATPFERLAMLGGMNQETQRQLATKQIETLNQPVGGLPAWKDIPLWAKATGITGLGLGTLGALAAAQNKSAPVNIDMSKVDLSKMPQPYSGPRLKVTLPTRHEGDTETVVDIPVPSLSGLPISGEINKTIQRDVRRRLRGESRVRTKGQGTTLMELAGLGDAPSSDLDSEEQLAA